MLTTCPCFDNLEFDNFDAGGPQCHFITSVTIEVKIQKLAVYSFKINVSHSVCGPGQDSGILFGSVSHLGWT